MWIYIIGLLCTVFNGALASNYRMEEHCNNEISFIWQSIYQARLVLNDDHLYDEKSDYYPYDRLGYCETTVEAWLTRYPQFMFFFQNLDLDCDDGHLEFYIDKTSNTRVTGLDYDVCGQNKPQGVFTVDSRYLRIKYVPKRSQDISNIFGIIITSFGEGSCPSYGHVCDNGRCIDGDLACNGYDSCGDDSGCDLSTGAIIGIIIGVIVALGLIISIVVCCICCRRRSKGTTGTVQNTASTRQAVTYTSHPMTSQPMYGMNQGSPYPTNMQTYPVPAPTNVTNQNTNTQDNLRPIYGFNQGTNYQSNQEPNVSHPQTSGQVDSSAAPPPSYAETIGDAAKI